MSEKNDNPQKQRALVLQGGGALGAYEAGVLSVLCERLTQEDKVNNKKDGPLFDIIAGTSIGAMNAAVLVSNVVNRNKTWQEAAHMLEHFWMDQAKEQEKEDEEKGGLSSTPDISKWWWWQDEAKQQTVFSASVEAARRYYSVKEYVKRGAPNVFYPIIPPELDSKFIDPDNTWLAYNSDPLKETIKRYSKDQNKEKDDDWRIATRRDKGEPRMLVISVNVVEGCTVAFDSYHTEAKDPENPLYDGDGITINHVMASGTLPVFYKFREIPKEDSGRKFCDGGILSNTPFRELLQAHSDFWKEVVGEDQDKIPDLDVYIINVHPYKQDKVPTDHDAVKERINDIIYSDRNSHYDEMVADLVTDYIAIIDKLKELAKNHFKNKDESDVFQNEFEDFIKTQAKSKGASSEDRKYEDLLKARFKLTKVIRIEPEEPESYKDSISGKGADFTYDTIKTLIQQGKKDARRVLEVQ
jgi:predicted acylesterase/phospholipase RssA